MTTNHVPQHAQPVYTTPAPVSKNRVVGLTLAVFFGPFGLGYWNPDLARSMMIGTVLSCFMLSIVTWPVAILDVLTRPPSASKRVRLY